jgi:hypothetical protein
MWILLHLPWRSLVALSCFGVLLLFLWTVADPIIYTLAGDHLTPSLLAHFAGFQIFTSDYLWKPIQSHPLLVGSGLLGVVLLLTASVMCFRAGMRAAGSITQRSCLLWGAFGAAFVAFPVVTGASFIVSPPEVHYLLDAMNFRGFGAPDVSGLRRFVGLPAGARWLNERYPLIHVPLQPALVRRSPPDIVVVSIESLRGRDLHWVTQRSGDLVLPALEALARRAVVYPKFISNGFPSSEGFISTSASTWPHDRRRIVLDFKPIHFDFLSARLRSIGYRSVRVEDDPNFGDEAHWIRQSFDEWIAFTDGGLPAERQMVTKIAQFFAAHDRERPQQPIFLDWKTANPHMPYDVPGDPPGSRADASPKKNYPRSLLTVDTAIGDLLAVLDRRSRAANTIVIVLGDHSNWVESSHTTALPNNEMVWTGAMIAGSPDWIGPARRDPAHASQVDVMPTVLALVGDYRPTAALGRDLLAASPLRPPQAVAVRPGGLRLDEGGTTLLVDRRHIHGALRTSAFEGEPQPAGTVDGATLARYAETWSLLIEQNRVWNPVFLDTPRSAFPRNTN